MKKRWITVFCAVLLAMLVVAAADTPVSAKSGAWEKGKTEVQTKGAFTYYIHPSKNGKEAWIYKIKIKGKKSKSLSIPKSIRGKKVTRLGCPDRGKGDNNEAYTTLFGTYIEPWHNWDGGNTASGALKTIRIPDSVKVIDRAAFSGMNSLTTIKLPKKIKKIDIYTFYGCDKLKTIVLPEQMESFQNSSLWGCPSLKEIRLSKKNKTFEVRGNALIRKSNSDLLFAATGGKSFTVPDGVKKITSYAFSGAVSEVIYIPDSVAEIEGKAFNHFSLRANGKIKDVVISEQNPVLARDGQCIYRRADKSLAVAVPDEKGKLRISEQVEKLTGDMSIVNCDTWNTSLEKVIYPSGLKYVIVPGLTEIDAKNVYFTGSVPPEVVDLNHTEYSELPSGQIYVPEAYEAAYEAWYKKFDIYTMVNGWHTYNPEAGF